MDGITTPTAHTAKHRPAPVGIRERIQTMDVLRGLALLGILLPNIADMSFPSDHLGGYETHFPAALDQIVLWGTAFFVQGKLYTMFSFLFGIGVAIQYERAQARGVRFAPWHLRRLLVLLVIGLLHDVLIWSGLILITYAVVGLFMLPFVRRQPRTLLIWAVVLILIPSLLRPVLRAVIHRPAASQTAATQGTQSTQSTQGTEGEQTTQDTAQDTAPEVGATAALSDFELELQRFGHGSYADQVRYRIGRLPRTFLIIAVMGSYILGMFLLGLLSWRCRVWTELAQRRALLVRLAAWGLPIGGALAAAALLLMHALTERPGPALSFGISTANSIANVALCLGYVGLAALVLRTSLGRRLLQPLAPVGRTALSNYILQSLVCTTIFYSFGLGLYGQIGPALNLLIVLLVWAFQLALSAWWIGHFRFGPVEWTWRSLSYGRRMPLLRRAAEPAEPI